MIRYLTAGESHGPCLVGIAEGFPAGLKIDKAFINNQLKKRQGGYGRGQRMQIEQDQVQFLSGIRGGLTLGSPIALCIDNKDWDNWKEIMSPDSDAHIKERVLTKPRPGHADLAGTLKYRHNDIRNTLERASARETAMRVAIGALGQCLLKTFDIDIRAHVVALGGIQAKVDHTRLNDTLYSTPLYCTDATATQHMIELIDRVKAQGDSVGGVIEVVAHNVPLGLGSHVHWDRKLDGRLAKGVMGIPGIKGVEVGEGFNTAHLPGSKVHDPIHHCPSRGFYHSTNHCGGIEGGISNGEDIIVRAAMKPIPTLYKPLHSVDIKTKTPHQASVERSDTCAVPAAAIVVEAVIAWEIARAFLEKFSGDHMAEIEQRYSDYIRYLREV